MLMFSRGAEVHRCRDAEAQRRFRRRVQESRCRGAEVQKCRVQV